jgi:hypothetical protein
LTVANARYSKENRYEKEAKVEKGWVVVSSLHKPIDTQSAWAHTLDSST